jgi:hypothetical protein
MSRVRDVIEHLRALKRHLKEMAAHYDELTPLMRANGSAKHVSRVEQSLQEGQAGLRAALAEVEGLGIHVKDIDIGLVDFPSLRDGRVVYLCWKVDEPAIAYWHELDAGYAGRKPI